MASGEREAVDVGAEDRKGAEIGFDALDGPAVMVLYGEYARAVGIGGPEQERLADLLRPEAVDHGEGHEYVRLQSDTVRAGYPAEPVQERMDEVDALGCYPLILEGAQVVDIDGYGIVAAEGEEPV